MPRIRCVTRRWPVELMGRYSVTPSTIPSTAAFQAFISESAACTSTVSASTVAASTTSVPTAGGSDAAVVTGWAAVVVVWVVVRPITVNSSTSRPIVPSAWRRHPVGVTEGREGVRGTVGHATAGRHAAGGTPPGRLFPVAPTTSRVGRLPPPSRLTRDVERGSCSIRTEGPPATSSRAVADGARRGVGGGRGGRVGGGGRSGGERPHRLRRASGRARGRSGAPRGLGHRTR